MYMVKKKQLRWRVTKMRLWRKYRGFSQERVAEILSRPPYSLPPYNIQEDITYASIGRYESGNQMPDGAMLEALAKIYETDIDSLLNRIPEAGKSPPSIENPNARTLLWHWDRAAPDERGVIIDIAKRVVKTGT